MPITRRPTNSNENHKAATLALKLNPGDVLAVTPGSGKEPVKLKGLSLALYSNLLGVLRRKELIKLEPNHVHQHQTAEVLGNNVIPAWCWRYHLPRISQMHAVE